MVQEMIRDATVITESTTAPGAAQPASRRSLLVIVSLLAAVGGAAMTLFPLPALWRMSWPYGLLFGVLGAMQLGAAAAVLARPTRSRLLAAAGAALAVAVLWAAKQVGGVLPPPDPWVPLNSVIGFTEVICAGLELFAALGLAAAALLGSRPRPPRLWRVLGALTLAPFAVISVLAVVLGVMASNNAFRGAGFPAGVVPPRGLPSGQMSTVEYCRPDGVPLAMDLYVPPDDARAGSPAPVAMYVHGGGLWGDRQMVGLGAMLGGHQGALFTPVQQALNARGFVVASIDYRLATGTPWPAQIEDAKCAVRFLRAHAGDLGIDPHRIGVWGSSGGGHLVSMLGLTGPEAGFDRGQFLDQSSEVQAVVDMFGLVDLNDMDGASAFAHFIIDNAISPSAEVRRAASPILYAGPGAPPFLILHGTEDDMIPARQSAKLADSLQAAGVPVTLVEVEGAGHELNTPGQQPSPEELAATVIDFFTEMLQREE